MYKGIKMKTKIIMIRHGESQSNKERIFTGQTNTPLTALGAHQAELAAKALADTKIDKIYASDLIRAYDTAAPVAKTHGLVTEKNEKLREIFAGGWEGLHYEEIGVRFSEDDSHWKENIGTSRCTGGESVAELYERVVSEVLRLAKENEGRTICLATHATPVRAVCAYASGIKAENLKDEPFPGNASISIFEYENGKLTAIKKGSTDHLCGLETFLPDDV